MCACVCVGVLQGYAVVPHKIIFNFLVTELRCLQKSFTIGKKLCARKNHKIVMEVWKAKPEMWASVVVGSHLCDAVFHPSPKACGTVFFRYTISIILLM